MIAYRGLTAHLVTLAVAITVALVVWTQKDAPRVAKGAEVEVWGGRPSDITSIEFSADDRQVKLVANKDAAGIWFEGTVEKTTRPPAPPPKPAPADAGSADGGADAASVVPPPPPVAEPKQETIRFVGVKQAQKLAESVAPLLALRALGKVEGTRDEEFGFDKSEGTLKVSFGATTRTLVLGGTTPGGGDRYARLESGEAYAVPGSLAQNLLFAESRLVERDLFEFEAEDAVKVRVALGDKARELVRLEEKKEGWADAATPTVQDETAGNWMSKLARLRILNYDDKAQASSPPAVVNVTYFAKGGRRLGELGLFKASGPDGKARFLARTSHTRWYAEVLSSAGEQIEQDLSSVLK